MSRHQAPRSLPTSICLFEPTLHASLLPTLVDMHVDTITVDHTLLRFLPPFTPTKRALMLDWWRTRLVDGLANGDRIAIIEVTKPFNEAGERHHEKKEGDVGAGEERWQSERIVGLVVLERDPAETGRFRAGVELLLVDPAFRRRGVAKRLMEKLEETAMEDGRSLLMLGTEKGSFAEVFFAKMGYVACGEIPHYGFSPKDGHLTDTILFYKHLGFTKEGLDI